MILLICDEENFWNAYKEVIIACIFINLETVHDLLRNLEQLFLESIYIKDSQVCPFHDRNEKTKKGKLNWDRYF